MEHAFGNTEKISLQLHEVFWEGMGSWFVVVFLRHTIHLQPSLFENRPYFSSFIQDRFEKINWQYLNTQIKDLLLSQGAELGEMPSFCWLLNFTSVPMYWGITTRFSLT